MKQDVSRDYHQKRMAKIGGTGSLGSGTICVQRSCAEVASFLKLTRNRIADCQTLRRAVRMCRVNQNLACECYRGPKYPDAGTTTFFQKVPCPRGAAAVV